MGKRTLGVVCGLAAQELSKATQCSRKVKKKEKEISPAYDNYLSFVHRTKAYSGGSYSTRSFFPRVK